MENRIYSTRQIRQIENTAFAGGVVSESLMERAGAAVFAELRLQFPDVASMVLLCGTGNNGGDGYVIARHAREAGISVMVIQSGPPKTPDAKTMAARAEAAGVAFSGWKGLLPEADVYAGSEDALIEAFRDAERSKTPLLGYFYSPQWLLSAPRLASHPLAALPSQSA